MPKDGSATRRRLLDAATAEFSARGIAGARVDRIAAAAEAADVVVLHYDDDYDRIAAVTGQATRWLAPKGSLR